MRISFYYFAKSDLRTFVHFVTESDKSPLPPFFKGGAENAPFRKGGRAQRGGISVRHCANLMWFDLDYPAMTEAAYSQLAGIA